MSNCLATSLGCPTLCSSPGLLTVLHLAKLQCQLFALLETFVPQVFLDLADLISIAFFQIWKSLTSTNRSLRKAFPFISSQSVEDQLHTSKK